MDKAAKVLHWRAETRFASYVQGRLELAGQESEWV